MRLMADDIAKVNYRAPEFKKKIEKFCKDVRTSKNMYFEIRNHITRVYSVFYKMENYTAVTLDKLSDVSLYAKRE